MNKVTIVDVAKKAGVSLTSVSRVINENTREHMREETKKRILKAIEELDYTPNKYAQFMKKRKSGVIGVVVPDISNQFFSLMVRGIQNTFYKHGYSVIIGDADNSLEKESKYIDILLKEEVEGVILTSSGIENRQAEKLIQRNYPLILADRKLKNIDAPYVGSDGFKDSCTLTRHLVGLGYREIGFVKGPPSVATATERFQGYLKIMKDNSFTVNNRHIKNGDYTFEGGYRAGKELFASVNRLPQAIIAANDLMAIGIMRILKEKGLRIPEDIGLAGFDNIPLHP